MPEPTVGGGQGQGKLATFFNTRVEFSGEKKVSKLAQGLNAIGNAFLAPTRYLMDGRTVTCKSSQGGRTSELGQRIIFNVRGGPSTEKRGVARAALRVLGKTGAGLFSIVGVPLGGLIKGLAMLDPELRRRCNQAAKAIGRAKEGKAPNYAWDQLKLTLQAIENRGKTEESKRDMIKQTFEPMDTEELGDFLSEHASKHGTETLTYRVGNEVYLFKKQKEEIISLIEKREKENLVRLLTPLYVDLFHPQSEEQNASQKLEKLKEDIKSAERKIGAEGYKFFEECLLITQYGASRFSE